MPTLTYEDYAEKCADKGIIPMSRGAWRKANSKSGPQGDGYSQPIMSNTKVGECGFKAYGSWLCFHDKCKFEDYLVSLMAGTSGAERDRAVDAFVALRRGKMFTDTD